jgi:hypothetical protein
MNKWLMVLVITSGTLRAGTPQNTPTTTTPDAPDSQEDLNVNARYTVEEVDVKRVPWEKGRVSLPLQKELDKIVGQNLDQEALDNLAKRIQKDLHLPKVSVRVSKGHMPDRVVVTFEAGQKERDLNVDLDRFLYQSKQGWTGEGGASMILHGNKFSFGLVSDADRLAERYAGIQAGYERFALGTDRVSLRFRFGDYHQQWNRTTLETAAPGDLYRTRQNFIPEVTVRLAEPLEWSVGFDFARYQTFIPNPVALGPVARTEASNAAVTTLRYRQRWGSDDPSDYLQTVMSSYGVRSGTGLLASDALFTRQYMDATYTVKHGHQLVKVAFLGGRIAGAPPMFERFVLGNAETLRGWNKFDINPAGATRAVHGSVEYIWRALLLFYDAGSAWNAGEDPEARNSLGVGLHGGGFELGVGFPVRTGRANPVMYVGMKF